MKRNAIDLGTLDVCTLFRKYFIPTLFGMLSISAVTAVDGILVGHGIGSDGIAAINICIPLLMLFTGIGPGGRRRLIRSRFHSAIKRKTGGSAPPCHSGLVVRHHCRHRAICLDDGISVTTARFLGASEHLYPHG